MTKRSAPKSKKRKRRSVSRRHADAFLRTSARARTLYQLLVKNGYTVKTSGNRPKPLLQPDRRDIAEYLFFEVATQFEQFAKRTLILEVQKRVGVNTTRAEHMVGSSEHGIGVSMGGWAQFAIMARRASGLLGKNSVYARAQTHLRNPYYQYLGMAHTARNRIAHGKGNPAFIQMLGKAPVSLPPRKRQGVSPGKFLAELPKKSADCDKWFFRFLDAYDAWVKVVRRKI